MIIINLKGGLGNQMFQYAFGRSYEIRNGAQVKFDPTNYPRQKLRTLGLSHFNVRMEMASDEEVKRTKYPFGPLSKAWRFFSQRVLRQFHIGFEPELFEKRENRYLDGFYNSGAYFEAIRPILLQELRLREPMSTKASEAAAQIASAMHSVSIHVRRGDYVAHKAATDSSYYMEACKLMQEKHPDASFFVFSDDIEWVKTNLALPKAIYVSKPGLPDYEEVILMSLCKSHIISASTFSWWGAWLNTREAKDVIAPQKWGLHRGNECDIIDPSWTLL